MTHSPFQPQNLSPNLIPQQSLQLPPSNSALCQLIAQRIAAAPTQRISFAEFMELALYQPQLGYYATNRSSAGIQQDFFTSAHLGQDFGELLAEQFVEMWHQLGQPQPFTLVEMGAGQGLLVQDIVRYLHRHHFSCFAALDYWIIETSAALVAAQQQRLQALQSWGRLSWRSWAEIEPDSIVGCCFSNELVDAFPVHQVIVQNGELCEVYVGLGAQSLDPDQPIQFQEIIGPVSTPRLAAYFKLVGIDLLAPPYSEGYRSEVNLAALDWLTTIATKLQRGYLLTVDYGYKAERYYRPSRSQGTLQCYYQHRHHSDPFAAIGLQDITAHVDFTALERQGERLGLQSFDLTQQGLFLMALGMGDRIAALSHPEPGTTVQEILQRRESLHALIDPAGLGNFGVLVQGKNLTPAQMQLKGLTLPPLG
jgi:SAM-dependent MidA family methyltransferase